MYKKIYMAGFGLIIMLAVAFATYTAFTLLSPALSGHGLKMISLNTGGTGERVTPGMTFREEAGYICGDVELIYQGPVNGRLINLNRQQLEQKYPPAEGWKVEFTESGALVTRQSRQQFCGMHSQYRHLGLKEGKLVIYQGPLGYDQIPLRQEQRYQVELLPSTFRDNLEKTAAFNSLSPAEQEFLKSELEFSDDVSLNNALESLDEFME